MGRTENGISFYRSSTAILSRRLPIPVKVVIGWYCILKEGTETSYIGVTKSRADCAADYVGWMRALAAVIVASYSVKCALYTTTKLFKQPRH